LPPSPIPFLPLPRSQNGFQETLVRMHRDLEPHRAGARSAASPSEAGARGRYADREIPTLDTDEV
jgi:hypothetical protein